MTDPAALAAFIARWTSVAGGAERANYQIFVSELCDALGVPKPGIASGGTLGDYQYEGSVPGGSLKGGTGFIDLYRAKHFILEAKQSKLPVAQTALPYDPADTAPATPSGAKYDQLMRDARRQAEQYARSLPASHESVPFLIVCDVGRAFELYFDYAGNGRGYGFFPDKQHYRLALADLAGDATLPGVDRTAAETLRAIWLDPASIDPRVRSADVTRDVAKKLAQVSLHLEQQGRIELKRRGEADAHHEAELIEGTALFLMRILFCMFAEDVGLLPEGRFTEFLQSCARPYDPANPGDLIDENTLRNGFVALWEKMGAPDLADRYAWPVRDPVKYFNGGLFESRAFYPLARNDLDSLIDAAKHRWTNVEPAIFGTLLEQALSPADRAKLGAHYTPRPYVERLVQATITDILDDEWEEVQDQIRAWMSVGDDAQALDGARNFLRYIQAQRVLDPACGTGNFLYVAMETLLRLESDVIETIATLGGHATPAIGPANFLGLELNPRAAVIAELVLWIGWLRWRTANDPGAVPDPVLRRTAAINFGGRHGYDAVLARDEAGEVIQPPLTAAWPQAEFIVGNPPFIAGQDFREEFTSDYAEAVWKANPRVGGGADFVMQWWDHAATLLTAPDTPLRRFGFVTTNSITQDFSRRVIARYLNPPRDGEGDQGAKRLGGGGSATSESPAENPLHQPKAGPPPRPGEDYGALSLVMAIPDHPWLKPAPAGGGTRRRKGEGGGPAAVRIAMTVAQAGTHEGRHGEVAAEHDLATDTPRVELDWTSARIHADLSVGTNVTQARPLRANTGICHDGVKLHGKGFAIQRSQAHLLGLGTRHDLDRYVRPYRNGKDLSQRNPSAVEDKYVIDFFGLGEKTVRTRFPEAWQYLHETVRPARQLQFDKSPTNDAKSYLDNWWLLGKPRPEMRPALVGLERYVVTVDTAKHRVFQFVDANMLCDDKLVVVASDEDYALGVLSSAVHRQWTLRVGGLLESRPVYVKSKTFDPFPFPDPTPDQRAAIVDIGEELDATRKAALAEHSRLTMTGLYNLVEKLRAGAALTPAEETDARDARARIVRHLHDQLDAAVAAAYGWADEWRAGTLTPSDIVARLVALNAQRAVEEAAGDIRWLRPAYQVPRSGK